MVVAYLVAGCAVFAGVVTLHTIVNAGLLAHPEPDRGGPVAPPAAKAAILLPVRNEVHRVEPCLRSLLAQGVAVLVLDDESSDGTAELVRSVGGTRVRLLSGAPTPPGWLGKPYACHQLATATEADILVFVDADVVLQPGAVRTCIGLLEDFDLVSPYPRIVAVGLGQRLIQPLLQWSWLAFLPLEAMRRSRRPVLAGAGGALLVVRAATYWRAGGHAAVRGKVLEDVELARAVKRAGGRISLADGSAVATCRMYDSWPETVDGYTKSMWAAFGSPLGAAVAVAFLIALYVVPPVAAVLGWLVGPEVALAGVAGYLLGVGSRVVTARATGGRVWPDSLGHPASVVLIGWLVGRSFRRRRTVRWKGRPVTSGELR